MSQLIVRDTDGHDIFTREMQPAERYTFYAAWEHSDTVSFVGKKWKLHSIAWTKPEQNLVLLVSFDSHEPVEYCDC